MAVPTGFVFLVRTDTQQTVAQIPLDSNGNFTVSSSNFSNSTIPFQAQYHGDSNFQPGNSPVVTEEQAPSSEPVNVTLAITPNPQQTNGNQTFSGSVTPA